MRQSLRRKLSLLVLVVIAGTPMAWSMQPASAYQAFPPGANVYYFDYAVDATTHLKTLDMDVVVPRGRFVGGIDFGTGKLRGDITLPASTFTFKLAGVVPLVTATAKIAQTKQVTGTVDIFGTFYVTATATFIIRIVSVYAQGSHENLVGNLCTVEKPMSVTMGGPANFGGASTFSGAYEIPKFRYCGTPVQTNALNAAISGPGNTFTAVSGPG